MAQASAVSAGQRYIKSYNLTQDRTEWEVVKVVGEVLPHAQLVNCRDPSDMRTVSCAELTQGGAFDLAEESGGPSIHGRLDTLVRGGADGSADGRARVGRLLRQITLAVRKFKRSCARVPRTGKAVMAAARELRRAG